MASPSVIENDTMFVYTPAEKTNDVVIFYPGAGGYVQNDIDRFVQNSPDKIIIINKKDVNNTYNLLAELGDLNIGRTSDIQIYTHSRGDQAAFNTAVSLNSSGYHTSNIVIMDTSHLLSQNRYDSIYEGIVITDDMAKNLAQNKTSVLIASQYTAGQLNQENMQTLMNAGVPLSHIYYNCRNGDWDANLHLMIKLQLIDSGIVNVLSGDQKVFGYKIGSYCKYSVYDYETNAWKDNLSVEEFCESIGYSTPYSLFDSAFSNLKELPMLSASGLATSLNYQDNITSDQEFVIDKMNAIRTKVSATNFIGKLDKSVGSIGGNPILDLENSILAQYFNTSGVLLDKIATETEFISCVAFDFDQLDKGLSLLLNDVKDSDSGFTNLLGTGANPFGISMDLLKQLNGGYHLDLSKYSEKPESGFELFLSNRIYTLDDFDTSYAKSWGYDKKQALEAFIGVCIAESDKTPDGLLSIASVALNRCESDNWSNYYANGKMPFDQMFANGGKQYSQILNVTSSNGNHVYENYMPSVVGLDSVNSYLQKNYNTDYESLSGVVMDALSGGLRNNDYTGFRAYIPEKYTGQYLNTSGGLFRYENPNKDAQYAEMLRASRISIPLSSTSYTGKDSIKVLSLTGDQAKVDTLTVTADNSLSNGSDYVSLASTSSSSSTSVSVNNTTGTSSSYAQSSYVATQTSYTAPSTDNSASSTTYVNNNSEPVYNSNTESSPIVTSVEPNMGNTVTTTVVNTPSASSTIESIPPSNETVNDYIDNSYDTVDVETTTSEPVYINPNNNTQVQNNTASDNYVDSTSNSQTYTIADNGNGGNKALKTIGGIAIGAAAIGGAVYAGDKIIKNIKNNDELGDDDDDTSNNRKER